MPEQGDGWEKADRAGNPWTRLPKSAGKLAPLRRRGPPPPPLVPGSRARGTRMAPFGWEADASAPVLARLSAAHADCQGRQEALKQAWHKVQAPAMELQMKTMEETIVILERELKQAAASLAKAEAEERSGGRSAVGAPADLELMLGVLEDKLIRTTTELETARRLTYFPAVEGYQLRFSFKDTFVAFKEVCGARSPCRHSLPRAPHGAPPLAAR
jgi:hypothetical protein